MDDETHTERINYVCIGVIAIAVANPTDLVKVRLQAGGKSTAVKRHYSGALNAYATIVRQVAATIHHDNDQ